MKNIIDRPWFFLIEFACITLALILWSNNPSLSWQPLIIALAPLIIRLLVGKSQGRHTPFNIPMAIFVITGAVGVWAAYNSANAWIKFWLILTSVLFYYLLARQTISNLWVMAGILSLMGLGVSIFFFLSNNWEIQPQKFPVINQIGTAWMKFRPDLELDALHPNDIAGVAVLAFPLSLALTLKACQRKSIFGVALSGLMTLIILAAIALSASRGAWMAVGITAGIWILWGASSWISKKIKHSQRGIFTLPMVVSICMIVGYFWITLSGRLNQIAIGEADKSVSDQRFHLFWSAIELIKDFPFTGGGLDGFPGLYSTYIKIDPNYLTGYSHNIYLDSTLEQGFLGGLMLCWILLGSILWLAYQPVPEYHSVFKKAILSSLMIISLHGLVDDIVYDTLFTPLLFILPGMAVGLVYSANPETSKVVHNIPNIPRLVIPVLGTIGIILTVMIIFHQSLLSVWYTNLGAVELAKVELADFPTGKWDLNQNIDSYSPAKSLFIKALSYEPENPRAHYRLGLIAMQNTDYSTAVDHLELAYHGDPYHRGILKSLGYSYLWNGQIEDAKSLLSPLPEIDYEVSNYIYWWNQTNRPDLAEYAENYLQ